MRLRVYSDANGQFDLNFIRVNAQQRYYDKLAGVTELKQNVRSSVKNLSVFLKKRQEDWCGRFPGQGTIYPDVVESGLAESPQ